MSGRRGNASNRDPDCAKFSGPEYYWATAIGACRVFIAEPPTALQAADCRDKDQSIVNADPKCKAR
ncbi:MAG: hypothetical protein ACKVSF_10805 [Alphaproteobacteria bacterium]